MIYKQQLLGKYQFKVFIIFISKWKCLFAMFVEFLKISFQEKRKLCTSLHTVATGQISVIFRVLKIWVWKTYLTKVIEYNLILYTILEVARFLTIVYKSSHKKLFSISNHNFKHRCHITWNWQLFNHFCLPHFGLRQITNTLEMTHRVSQCC